MVSNIIQFSFIIFFPAFTIFLGNRYRIFKWLSPIVLCYLTGIIIGNLGFLHLNKDMLSFITWVSVCLAIPILLFSSNFMKWLKHSRLTFLSFTLGIVGVVLSSALAYIILRDQITDPWKVAGMMIGVYTGGTPNMSAIGLSLHVEEEVFILLNAADIVFTGIYFIFLITLAKKALSYFLPAFKGFNNGNNNPEIEENDLKGIGLKQRIIYIIFAIVVSVIIFVIAVGISWLIKGELVPVIIILVLTTLGILSSFSSRIQAIKGTYETAEYFLLVFAVAMASRANFSELIEASSAIFYFCGIVVGCSVVFHIIFSTIFRIDTDTVIITSTAAIFGPAFVGPVANGIRNKEVIVPGIAMGLLGYAIGNYLGLAVAGFLQLLN